MSLLLLGSLLVVPISAFAGRLSLAWDPSPNAVAGYRVYYGTSPDPRLTGTSVTLGNQTTTTILNLTTGVRYYVVVTAYSGFGESAPSNEVDGIAVADPSNQPPSVTLTAPANGTTYSAPAAITLTANASDPDGNVARVDFYQGGTLIQTDTAAPYSVTWSNVPVGTYSLTAVATDDAGAPTTSGASVVTVNPGAGLPSGWTAQDIGSPTRPGSTSYGNGTFTATGGGLDIWNNADQFHYAHRQAATGDVDIVARVMTLGQTNPWSKAGVMIRESLAANSAHASLFLTPGNGVSFQHRTVPGGLSTSTTPGTGSAPVWLKLERRGITVTASLSTNGTSWTALGSQSLALGATFYVGLATSSHDDAATVTATFDNVLVQTPSSPVSFTDDPLTPGVHMLRLLHITELRTRIDALRILRGLGVWSWTPLVAGATVSTASHVTELRNALNAVYLAMSRQAPTYTDGILAAGTVIKAVHITELRAAVRAVE